MIIEGATAGEGPINRDVDFLPKPKEAETDPVLYEAWRNHMIAGFEQNNVMFKRVLEAFMRPYTLTVAMYVALFLVGIGGFIAAVVLAVTQGLQFSVLFGGMSVLAFLAFFTSHPLRALEQNLLFITWLGVIYNTYWTRLMYANDNRTVQHDLDSIERNAINELSRLVDKHDKLALRRPSGREEPLKPAEQP
jgi:hypothetical protein